MVVNNALIIYHSFGAELPYGDYTLKPISKGTTDTEWMADVKAERHYITATISETGLTLTPSIPLTMNSLSSVTNGGSEESSASLYMYSGSTLKSVVQTASTRKYDFNSFIPSIRK
jgi:hypothetical protein